MQSPGEHGCAQIRYPESPDALLVLQWMTSLEESQFLSALRNTMLNFPSTHLYQTVWTGSFWLLSLVKILNAWSDQWHSFNVMPALQVQSSWLVCFQTILLMPTVVLAFCLELICSTGLNYWYRCKCVSKPGNDPTMRMLMNLETSSL